MALASPGSPRSGRGLSPDRLCKPARDEPRREQSPKHLSTEPWASKPFRVSLDKVLDPAHEGSPSGHLPSSQGVDPAGGKASQQRMRSPETRRDMDSPLHNRRGRASNDSDCDNDVSQDSDRGLRGHQRRGGNRHGSRGAQKSRVHGSGGSKSVICFTDNGTDAFRELATRLVYEFSSQMSVSLWSQVGEQLVQLHNNMVLAITPEKHSPSHNSSKISSIPRDQKDHVAFASEGDLYVLGDSDSDEDLNIKFGDHGSEKDEPSRRISSEISHVRFATMGCSNEGPEDAGLSLSSIQPPAEPQASDALEVIPPHGEPTKLSIVPHVDSEENNAQNINLEVKVVDTDITEEEVSRRRAMEAMRQRAKRSKTSPELDQGGGSKPRPSALSKGSSTSLGVAEFHSSLSCGPSNLPGSIITLNNDASHSLEDHAHTAMKRTVKAVLAASKLKLPGQEESHAFDWDDDTDNATNDWYNQRASSRRASRVSSLPSSRRQSSARASCVALARAVTAEAPEDHLKAAMFKVRDIWESKDDEELMTQKSYLTILDGETKPKMLRHTMRKKLSSASLGSTVKLSSCRTNQVPVHPDSKLRVTWELLTLVLIGYDIIVIPLHFIGHLDSPFTISVTWLARIVWTFDICMSFLTGVYVHGALDLRPFAVARQYCLTWFVFDMCLVVQEWASITADDNIEGSTGMSFRLDNFSAVRTLRLLRFLRLLRLLKAGFMISDIIERFNSTSFVLFCDIVKSIFGLIIINHIVACVWYGIGDAKTGWVHMRENGMMGASFVHRYLTSLHWSLTNFTGSTEVVPRTATEMFFAVFIVLLALILFSSFLGNLTNTMMELQELQHERYQQQRILRRFLRDNNISSMLSNRVKKYLLGIAVEDQRQGQLTKALTTLPEQLLMDIHDEARGPLLAGHQFFCDLRQQHPRLLRQICHCALTDRTTQPNEMVFAVGDACFRMFFMMEGSVQYALKRAAQSPLAGLKRKQTSDFNFPPTMSRGNTSDGDVVQQVASVASCVSGLQTQTVLTRGQWISEAGLWTKWEHCGNLSTVGLRSRFLELNAEKFAGQVKHFENAYLSAKRYAMLFVEYMNSDVQCTDLLELDMTLYQRDQSHRDSTESASAMSRNSGSTSIESMRSSYGATNMSKLKHTAAQLIPTNMWQFLRDGASNRNSARNSRNSRRSGGNAW